MPEPGMQPPIIDVRQSWLRKLARYEGGLVGLVQEIRETLPHVTREDQQILVAKLELVFAHLEQLILADPSRESFDDRMSKTSKAVDQLIMVKAGLDRRRLQMLREEESELEDRQRALDRMRGDLEKDVAPGHGFGEG